MKLKVFAVYDKKAESYQNPFMQVTCGLAERIFRTMANDDKTTICQYPEDYELYYIADFETDTGSYDNLTENVRVCGAVDVKENNDKIPHTVQQAASN